jgi:hypothetical protein
VLPDPAVPALNKKLVVMDVAFPTSAGDLGQTDVYLICTSADSCVLGLTSNNNDNDGSTVKIAVGEWHHFVVVVARGVSGGTIFFYVDGRETGVTGSTYVTSSAPPSKVEFGGAAGSGFVGLLDEVKIWQKQLELRDFVVSPGGAMFSRSPGSGTIAAGLAGYYRFNRGLVMELDPAGASSAAVMSAGVPVLQAGPVPWEPALMHDIDGVETGVQAHSADIKSVANGGGGTAIQVTGFNFAPSQWLQCAWGVVQSAPGVAHAAPAPAVGSCPATGVVAGLGRVDGRGLSVGPFDVGEMPGAPYTVPATRGAGAAAQTSLSCVPPATPAVGLHAFGVVNPRMLAAVPFEVSETALRCDGVDDVLTASPVGSAAFPSGSDTTDAGYTMFAWVRPSHATAPAGTVMSFQSGAPQLAREGEIVYDGALARFAYYDDNILVAAAPAVALPGEWHYVAVSVARGGDGVLVVDGTAPVEFSTRSRPSGGALTVCARLAPPAPGAAATAATAATASAAHFAGEVDEVRVFGRAMTPSEIDATAFDDNAAAGPGLLLLFNFTYGFDAYPNAGFTVAGAPGRIASTGPWRSPLVARVEPSRGVPAGGERITVSATNLAPSQWLRLDLGTGADIVPSSVAGSLAVVTTPINAGCTDKVSAAGVSAALRGVSPGFQGISDFGLSSTLAGLASGLVAYVPVDAGTITVASRHAASVGDPASIFLTGEPATDRDGFEGGGAAFSAGVRLAASPTLAAAVAAALVQGHTVMAWVRLDVDAVRATLGAALNRQEDLALNPNVELAPEVARVGGWNLVAITDGATSINGKPAVAEGEAGAWAAGQHRDVLAALGSPTLAGVGGGEGGGGFGLSAIGALDQLWVYSRKLAPCEVTARFRVTATAVSTTDGPVPFPLATPTGGLSLTLSLWVYPGADAPAPQIIASTADVIGGGSATLVLALAGPTVVLALKTSTCACELCLPALELRSSGSGGDGGGGAARVLPKRWAHVAVSLGGGRADVFVDGVLAATAPLPALPGGDLGAIALGSNFDGLVASASVRAGPSAAFEVKAAAQCTPRSRAAGVARLNEGSGLPLPPPYHPQEDGANGVSASAAASDAVSDDSEAVDDDDDEDHEEEVAAAIAYARRWVDASWPEIPTHGASTEIFGEQAVAMVAGTPALYTVTAKTACGARRVTPEPIGAPLGVTLGRVGNASVAANVIDMGDGNYAVSVLGGVASGLACGVWSTSVTLGGVAMKTFNTVISPAAASPIHSYIEGGASAADGSPFAAVGFVIVQLMDAFGCAAAGVQDATALSAVLEGPHSATTGVEALGAGRYRVTFLPESPGTYRLAVTLLGEPIKNAAQCVTISVGAGADFVLGSAGVKLSPPASRLKAFELTAAAGMAVEAWIKPRTMPTQKASVVYKGGPARSGDAIKGFQITYDANYVVTVSVYVGRSESRAATASAANRGYAPGQWLHLGLLYDGVVVTLTFDGIVVATSGGDPTSAAAMNPYPTDADVTVGSGVDGAVDEVRLWDGGLGPLPTPASIAARLYCPPFKLSGLSALAAYVPFSERAGAGIDSPVFSAACTPVVYHANRGNPTALAAAGCGVAGGVSRPAGREALASTPLGVGRPTTRGPGVPSALYSTGALAASHTAGLTTNLRWSAAARDECGYDYITAAADVVALLATPLTTVYIDTTPKAPDATSQLPLQEMPVTVQGQTLSPPNALAAANICTATTGTDNNVYRGTLGAVNVAGSYTARILISGVPVAAVFPLTVVSGTPTEFTVVGPRTVAVTAGVTAWTRLRLIDAYGNALTADVEVGAVFRPAPGQTPWVSLNYAVGPSGSSFDPALGVYTVSFVLPEGPEVDKLVQTVTWGGIFTVPGVVPQEVEYIVSPPRWRQVTAAAPPAAAAAGTDAGGADSDPLRGPGARFEHAAAIVRGGRDLIVFGGAAADKTYLSDAWRLRGVHLDAFAYVKRVTLVSNDGGVYVVPEGGAVVEVVVDTGELIAANRMGAACLDVMFAPPGELSPAGSLPFYLDPHPGCNATQTSYLVRVPAGPLAPVDMYYGDPNFGVVTRNAKNDPEAVFAFYDGFEEGADGDAPGAAKWDGSCTEAGTGPEISSAIAYAGAGALYVPEGARGVLSGVAAAGAAMPESYRLRAWFWDSGADVTSHVLSPGYDGACPSGGGNAPNGGAGTMMGAGAGGALAPGLPGPGAVAVGTYSRCHRTDFCVASPWVSSASAPRSASWHRLEVESRAAPQFSGSAQALRVTVDGALLKAGPPSPLTAPTIAVGVGVAGGGAHAFWDEVSVLALAPISAQVPAMSGDVLVAADTRAWTKVELEGPPPPPRYGHTLVTLGEDVVTYGGERSSFVLGEVWTLRFAPDGGAALGDAAGTDGGGGGGGELARWTYAAPPAGLPQPAPRYDHAAAVLNGDMVVLGGRDGEGAPLGDVWSWDAGAARWTALSEMMLDPPRFGHATAELGGALWVFGGYTGAAAAAVTPFTRQLLKCTPGVGCVDAATTCPPGFAYDPPASLTPRYLSSLHADAEFLYVYGGASIERPDGFAGVHKFEPASCAWRELSSAGVPQGRYEHASVVAGGRLVVVGGHAAGVPQPEVYMFPLHA